VAKFVFRLDAVRKVRQRAFEEKQRIVAERRRAIAAEQARAAALRAEIQSENETGRREQASGPLDIPQICRARLRVQFLRRQIAESEARTRLLEQELVRERAEMLAANVAVKALDKLKERRLQRFNQEQERLAAAEQGELALQLHRRQSEMERNAV
jgi:flagellar biosynthesis chaperone FliJ